MRRPFYYTLISSLPYLAHFEHAERLPINRERLDQRLRTLDVGHGAQLEVAEELLEWHRWHLSATDEKIVGEFRKAMTVIDDPGLREFVAFRMDQRTMMAALRRRHRGEPAPAPGRVWGTEPRSEWARTHWEAPDLGLSSHYPWVGEAWRLIGERDALGLDRLLMNVVWNRLGRLAESRPFGFEQVVAFVFRWDIVNRWLAYQAEAAVARFSRLVAEGLGEHHEHYA